MPPLARSILVFLLCAAPARAAVPLEVVMIDAAAETELGGFPLAREHVARAVRAIEACGARALVLKFFFDRPGDAQNDAALATALRECRIPVVLQACLDDTEAHPNPLPERFTRPDLVLPAGAGFQGRAGWLPVPAFATGAQAVGFIDALNPAPIVVSYQGKAAPSLYLVTLELLLGGKVTVRVSDHIEFGGRQLKLDARQCVTLPYPARDVLIYVPLLDVLRGGQRPRLKDKVVVLAYDGVKMHTFPTPIGPIKAHRLFVYELIALYKALESAPMSAAK